MQVFFFFFFSCLFALSIEACTECQNGCANLAVGALSYKTYQIPYNCQSGPIGVIVKYKSTNASPVEIYYMPSYQWVKVENGEENWPEMVSGQETQCMNTAVVSGNIVSDATLVVYCTNFISDCDGLISFESICTNENVVASFAGGDTSVSTYSGTPDPSTTLAGTPTPSTAVGVSTSSTGTPIPEPVFVRLELFSDSLCSSRIFSIEEKLHTSNCASKSCSPYGSGWYP